MNIRNPILTYFKKTYLTLPYNAILTTKRYRYNIFNLKTKNFRQDIAYLAFIKTSEELEFTKRLLLRLAYSNRLRNYLLLIHIRGKQDLIYYAKYNRDYLIIEDYIEYRDNITVLYQDTLAAEGFQFFRKFREDREAQETVDIKEVKDFEEIRTTTEVEEVKQIDSDIEIGDY